MPNTEKPSNLKIEQIQINNRRVLAQIPLISHHSETVSITLSILENTRFIMLINHTIDTNTPNKERLTLQGVNNNGQYEAHLNLINFTTCASNRVWTSIPMEFIGLKNEVREYGHITFDLIVTRLASDSWEYLLVFYEEIYAEG